MYNSCINFLWFPIFAIFRFQLRFYHMHLFYPYLASVPCNWWHHKKVTHRIFNNNLIYSIVSFKLILNVASLSGFSGFMFGNWFTFWAILYVQHLKRTHSQCTECTALLRYMHSDQFCNYRPTCRCRHNVAPYAFSNDTVTSTARRAYLCTFKLMYTSKESYEILVSIIRSRAIRIVILGNRQEASQDADTIV